MEKDFPFLRVIRLEKENKWYSNSCIPFNIGFEEAIGDKIIIQNPECYHFGDILQYVNENLKENHYLSFGCFSLDKKNTDDDLLFFDRENISSIIEKNPYVVKTDGGLGWYNHSQHRPGAYHFCTALMTSDLVDLGGFDSRYSNGFGYDDDDLIFRIRQKGMKIKFLNNIVAIHQNHYVHQVSIDEQKQKYTNEKAKRNQSIFNNITKKAQCYRANYLKIGNYYQEDKNTFVQLIKRRLNLLFAN